MKAIVVISLCVFLINLPAVCQNSDIMVHHYNINLNFNPEAENIDIDLTCKIQKKDSFPKLIFLLNHESKISSIMISRNENWKNIPFEFRSDSLIINTDSNYKPGQSFYLRFKYSIHTGKFNDTDFVTDRGDRWYPLVMDQIYSFKLICRVPVFCRVLSAGDLISANNDGKTAEYIWESQSAVFKLPLIILNPAKHKNAEKNKVDFYYSSLDSSGADKVLEKISSVMNYYNDIIAPYPYKRLTLFEINDFSGINTGSGLLMVGTKSLEMFAQGYEEGIILTLAQQWFGAGVFAKFGENGFFFLSLSLPHYLRLMYIRHSEGEDKYRNTLNEMINDYKKFAGQEDDIPILDVDFPNTREKAKILYDKGPWVLSKIDSLTGNSNWIQFIRNLYKSFHGKILTCDDFMNSLSNYIKSKNDLNMIKRLLTEKGF